MLKLPRSRAARLGVQGAVLVALVAGTAAYAVNDTTVTLTVDGDPQDVRVFNGTVEDVLAAAEVDLSERDVVAPALDTRVSDDTQVVVRHARLLTLTVDGETRQHWTTALSVDDALEDVGVRAAGAVLSASRSTPLGRDGLDLDVVTPKAVTVTADGQTRPISTTALDVRHALADAGVLVGTRDRVSESMEGVVGDGLELTVVRVASEVVHEERAIAFETVERRTDRLFRGQSEVATQGRDGQRTLAIEITTEDGVEVDRARVGQRVDREAADRVVLVGTKERPAPEPEPAPEPDPAPEPVRSSSPSSSSSSSSSPTRSSAPAAAAAPAPAPAPAPAAPEPAVSNGSTWDRLAQCESGGNWSINTGNGYYGGLQFSAQSWRAVGGTGLPHQASRATQIAMGEKLRAIQGWGAWPACSSKLGLR